MALKLKNNAVGYLAAVVTASDIGLTLQTGQGAAFPTLSTGDYFYATITSSGGTYEVIKVTARASDGFTIVRAQEGTTAQSFGAGSRFELRVTSQNVLDVVNNTTIDNSSIGATTPASGRFTTLTATGTLNVSGVSTLAGTTASSLTVSGASSLAAVTASGTLAVSGATSLAALTASGNATVNGNVSVGGTLVTTGAATLNGAVTVDDNLVVTGTTAVTGGTTLSDLTYTGTVTGGTGLINIGSGQIYKDASGNIGVNTTSPNALGAGRIGVTVNGSTDSTLWLQAGNTNKGYVRSTSVATSLVGSGVSLALETNSANNVTIGTNGLTRVTVDSSGYVQGTPNGNNTGRIASHMYYRLNTDLAGSTGTSAQNILGVGISLISGTVYEFEALLVLAKTAGTTSHTIGLGFGGTATINNILYKVVTGYGTSALPILDSSTDSSIMNTVTNTVTTAAITTALSTVGYIVRGTVSINNAGTFIPQYTLSAGPGGAYSTVAGSYFRIAPIASSGIVNIGSWT
jgi:cytoskeletal protein CcmA (bactofilin family)